MKKDMKALIAEIKDLAAPQAETDPAWQPMEYWCQQFGACYSVTSRIIKKAISAGKMRAEHRPIRLASGAVSRRMRYRLVGANKR